LTEDIAALIFGWSLCLGVIVFTTGRFIVPYPDREYTMPRFVSHSSVALLLASVFVASPVESKKREKEKSIFDECPVAETIRVPAEASLAGLESLAACEDIEIAPADPDEVALMPPVNIGTSSDGSDWQNETQTASLPTDIYDVDEDTGKLGKKRKMVSAKSKKPKKKEVLSVGVAPNGTRYISIVPKQQEVEYGMADTSATVQFAPSIAPGSASGDSILAMRPNSYSTIHDTTIANTAARHRVDPLLVHAVIKQESGYKQGAVSHAGAQGLMQIMPGTGDMLGVPRSQLRDPATNIDAGTRLLKKLAIKYNGNFELVLAAYNAGEGAVAKYGNRIPPYRETQDYVKKVMGNYNRLLAENGGGGTR
jgi:Transglycosylase SLT domain